MAALTSVRYRWLQTGGAWTESTDLAEVEYTDIDDDLIPAAVPLSVTKQAGPEPSVLNFQIRFAGAVSPPGDGLYGSDNLSNVADRRRPDGTTGDMYYPIVGSANVLKEFDLIRLMDAASESARESGTGVFLGVITHLELSSSSAEGDIWNVTATEIARWHMDKIGLYGCTLLRYYDEEQKWQTDALPVYNEEGDADHAVDSEDEPYPAFINRNYNSIGGQRQGAYPAGAYWKLGEVLNCLRTDFNQAGGSGAISTANYLDWAEANDSDKWPWLFALDGVDQIIKDFAIGGMSLAEAIDQIVTKAGPYEWRCEWDDDGCKYVLEIYASLTGDGAAAKDYTRGALTASVEPTPPQVDSISLQWSWANSLSQIKPLGAKKRWEISLDTGSSLGDYGGLKKGWTADQETAYEADKDNGGLYPSVFQRFVVSGSIDWSKWFGHANYLSGPRRPMPKLLAEIFGESGDGGYSPTKLNILAWRKNEGNWEPAPDGVAIHVDSDGAILITGKAESSVVRWGEDGEGLAYDMRVTIAVEDDARLTSTAPVVDIPTGWPTMEKVLDNHSYKYEKRQAAYLPTDVDHKPVIDNPTATEELSEEIYSDSQAITIAAKRTLKAYSRPRLRGSIRVTSLDWTIAPGQKIGTLTGGGSRPNITINAIADSIVYDMAEGREGMTINFGGDTA